MAIPEVVDVTIRKTVRPSTQFITIRHDLVTEVVCRKLGNCVPPIVVEPETVCKSDLYLKTLLSGMTWCQRSQV